MIEDIKLNLDMQKKIFFSICCAYYFYNYHDVPGVIPMMILGNLLYNNEFLKEDISNSTEAGNKFRALNVITTASLATSFLIFDTSFFNPSLGLLLGELLTSLAKDMKDEVTEDSNISINKAKKTLT